MLIAAAEAGRSTPVHGVRKADAQAFLSRLSVEHRTFAAASAFDGSAGQVVALPDVAGRFAMVLIGLGDTPDPFAAGALERFREGTFSLGEGWTDTTLATLGVLLGHYSYDAYRENARRNQRLVCPDGVDEADIRRIVEGVTLARDLINTPANDLGPAELADTANALARKHGARLTITDGEALEAGFPMIAAVGAASARPPLLIDFTWGKADAPKITLVGKGVVFDTGGLSLKDTKNSMDLMKSDMGGAAVVVGAFEALADLDVPLHVIGLVPATDNRPGNKAYVPGDVVTMHSGATVEVMNTDAEGRMLLADALSYAKRYDPALVVDLATLTGASIVALGSEAAAVMTNESDDAAERLYAIQRAGERSGERVHPLPMYDDYKKQLDSNVADLKNVGGRSAGAITAGKFLEHFTGHPDGYPWLHLDIAGPSFLQSEKPYRPKGGTGFGVRLLLTFLAEYVAKQ